MQPYIFDISIFGISIAPKWYGLMYALGFIISYQFMKKWGKLTQKELDSLLFHVFFGVLGGGRVGYIIFYNFKYYIENPYDIFKIWEGGMSFHGGLLGVILAVFLFSRKYNKSFFSISDALAVILPVSLGLGRIGNYINKELLGYSPYDGPLSIYKDGIGYFPSTLLEMLTEGAFLLLIMHYFANRLGFYKDGTSRSKNEGILSGIFLLGYGLFRLFIEQFRLPDPQIGYLFHTDWFTLGILYSIPMIFFSVWIIGRRLIKT